MHLYSGKDNLKYATTTEESCCSPSQGNPCKSSVKSSGHLSRAGPVTRVRMLLLQRLWDYSHDFCYGPNSGEVSRAKLWTLYKICWPHEAIDTVSQQDLGRLCQSSAALPNSFRWYASFMIVKVLAVENPLRQESSTLRPIRNQAEQVEVSRGQVSETSFVFAATPQGPYNHLSSTSENQALDSHRSTNLL